MRLDPGQLGRVPPWSAASAAWRTLHLWIIAGAGEVGRGKRPQTGHLGRVPPWSAAGAAWRTLHCWIAVWPYEGKKPG